MKEAENDKMDTKSCLFFFVSFCAFYEEEDEEGKKNFDPHITSQFPNQKIVYVYIYHRI